MPNWEMEHSSVERSSGEYMVGSTKPSDDFGNRYSHSPLCSNHVGLDAETVWASSSSPEPVSKVSSLSRRAVKGCHRRWRTFHISLLSLLGRLGRGRLTLLLLVGSCGSILLLYSLVSSLFLFSSRLIVPEGYGVEQQQQDRRFSGQMIFPSTKPQESDVVVAVNNPVNYGLADTQSFDFRNKTWHSKEDPDIAAGRVLKNDRKGEGRSAPGNGIAEAANAQVALRRKPATLVAQHDPQQLGHSGAATMAVNVDANHLHGQGYALNETTHLPLWKPEPLTFRLSYDAKVKANTGYCFNTRVSQGLPLDRAVPDYNSRACSAVEYSLSQLPAASVVIVFYNEDLSVLLRSIHSVVNRSPPELLKEVIVVDDFSNHSTHPWLGEQLRVYIDRVPKTVLRRLNNRHGLMRARMAGFEWATAPVVVFLDSHVEATPRWLQPLVKHVYERPAAVAVPLIHTIDFDNFHFLRDAVGPLTFSWSLGQVHLPFSSDFEPIPSPVMAGGLLAVSREWFSKIGGYDPELRLYGGEEMEMGFKAWMCGDGVYVLPCSHVGHVFRSDKYWKHQVYPVAAMEIFRNKRRVAAIWMDHYYRVVQLAIPELEAGFDIGSIDDQLALRRNNKCREFSWYIDNVVPQNKIEHVEATRGGAVRAGQICADSFSRSNEGEHIGAYPCHNQHGTQGFLVARHGTIYLVTGTAGFCWRPAANDRDLGDFFQRTAASTEASGVANTPPLSIPIVITGQNCHKHTWEYVADQGYLVYRFVVGDNDDLSSRNIQNALSATPGHRTLYCLSFVPSSLLPAEAKAALSEDSFDLRLAVCEKKISPESATGASMLQVIHLDLFSDKAAAIRLQI